MSRTGNEMIAELSKLLPSAGTIKTASEKEDKAEKKEEAKKEKEEAKEEAKKEKEEAKEEKEAAKEKAKKEKADAKKEKADKKKKKAEVMLSVVNDLVKLANELDAAGSEEASSLVDDALKAIVSSMEQAAHDPEEIPTFEEDLEPSMPEGMGFGGDTTEDKIDALLSDPATREMLKQKLGV